MADENQDLLEKHEDDWTIFDWIRFLCGAQTLQQIRDAFAGLEIKVPTGTGDGCETWSDLVVALGEDNARCFVKNFGAETLYIPFAKNRKKDRIKQLVRQGKRNRDIALLCEVSERYVRMVRAKVNINTLH